MKIDKYEYQHIFTNFNQIYLNIYSSKVIQIGFVFIWQGDNVFILLTRSCLVCKQDCINTECCKIKYDSADSHLLINET